MGKKRKITQFELNYFISYSTFLGNVPPWGHRLYIITAKDPVERNTGQQQAFSPVASELFD